MIVKIEERIVDEGWTCLMSAAAVKRETQASWHYQYSAVVGETVTVAAAPAAVDLEALSIQTRKEYHSPTTVVAVSSTLLSPFASDPPQQLDDAAVLVRVGFGGYFALGAHCHQPVFGGAALVVQVGTFVV